MILPEGEEVILRGIPLSKGIGIGHPLYFSGCDDEPAEVIISKTEIEQEIDRYRHALLLSRKDVEALQKHSMQECPSEAVSILGTHLELMQDPLLTSVIEERIRHHQRNTESIFRHVIQEYKDRFSTMQDHFFQERVRDIVDVSRRILHHLRPEQKIQLNQIPNNSIVLAYELVPTDTVEASSSMVRAFVTATGGVTSHAAIIARAKGIPYVANVDIKYLKKIEVHSLIVDGSQGLVILNPTKATLKKYQEIQKKHLEAYKMLKGSMHLKAETIDGYEVRVFANLENPKEVQQVIKTGAYGVGLFRSEYLFLTRKSFPSEEEQFLIYKKMVQALKGRPLVVRIFDVGGDKKVELSHENPDSFYFATIGPELNPALGCRAIRFLIRYPDLLDKQIRAILRAAVYGEIHILIPMVADYAEVLFVREKMDEVLADFARKGIKTAKKVQLGCMIEVPASAIMADSLVDGVDFLSIGTNDLVQYVLAADRNNSNTSNLYFTTHPSILRLVRMVVSAASRKNTPVILCGESAADPSMIPLFIGLGIREFSVAARHIPVIKHTIRKWRVLDACQLAEAALEFSATDELRKFLISEVR